MARRSLSEEQQALLAEAKALKRRSDEAEKALRAAVGTYDDNVRRAQKTLKEAESIPKRGSFEGATLFEDRLEIKGRPRVSLESGPISVAVSSSGGTGKEGKVFVEIDTPEFRHVIETDRGKESAARDFAAKVVTATRSAGKVREARHERIARARRDLQAAQENTAAIDACERVAFELREKVAADNEKLVAADLKPVSVPGATRTEISRSIQRRRAIIGVGILALLVAGIAACSVLVPSNSSSDSTPSTAVTTTSQPQSSTLPAGTTSQAPSEQSRIKLVRSSSVCREVASQAKIRVFASFRNTGDAAGSVDVTPWRRYSDNTVNQSSLDMFTAKVPPHRVKIFYADYGFDSTKHDLIQCGLILDGDFSRIRRIRVQVWP